MIISIIQTNNELNVKFKLHEQNIDPFKKYCVPLMEIQTTGIQVYPKLQAIDLQIFGNKLLNIEGEEMIAQKSFQTIYKFQTKMSHDNSLSPPLMVKQLIFNNITDESKKHVTQAAAFYFKISEIQGTLDFAGCFSLQKNTDTIYYMIHEYHDKNIDQLKEINGQPNPMNIHNQLPQPKQRIEFYQKLFQIVDNFRSINLIHNDIKPSNIYLRLQSYETQPFLSGFQFMINEGDAIRYTSACYEHIYKRHLNYSSYQLDVFSMAMVIIELEAGPEILCKKFNEKFPNYAAQNVTETEVNYLYSLVQNAMQIKDFTPKKNDGTEVQQIQQCDNLGCILIFCIQPDISFIPDVSLIVQAFNNIIIS